MVSRGWYQKHDASLYGVAVDVVLGDDILGTGAKPLRDIPHIVAAVGVVKYQRSLGAARGRVVISSYRGQRGTAPA